MIPQLPALLQYMESPRQGTQKPEDPGYLLVGFTPKNTF